jgi:hypothetical protein
VALVDFSPRSAEDARSLALYPASFATEAPMLIHATEPLFAWGELEGHATPATIRDFLDGVPDQELIAGLRAARGRGRDEYPIRRLWQVRLLTIALRHA